MAQGWLGWLDAMKPILESVYGNAANADNIIAQVRNDYANTNYHGYNFMYASSFEIAHCSHCVTGRKAVRTAS